MKIKSVFLILFGSCCFGGAPTFSIAEAGPVNELKAIAGKVWPLTNLRLNGKNVALSAKKTITLKLAEDGKASGKSAVNRYFGGVELDAAGGCKWGKGIGSTRMAGPPEMMDIERSYFQALPKTTKVDLTGGVLTLSSADGKTVLVFGGKTEPAGKSIDGQVIFEDDPSAKLPAGAIIKVLLQDVSLADAPAKQLGMDSIDDAKSFPVKFKVPYSEADLVRGHRYSISARIEDGTGLRFINDTAHPVFQDGKPPAKPMDLVVVKVK